MSNDFDGDIFDRSLIECNPIHRSYHAVQNRFKPIHQFQICGEKAILDPFLYAGTLAAIIGPEGCGKTQLAIEFGALVSNQKLIRPIDNNKTLSANEYGVVLFCSVEDDLNSVNLPRIRAAGANPYRFGVCANLLKSKIVELVEKNPHVRLVILDGWSLISNGYQDGNKALAMAIEDLLALARKKGFCILLVGHFSKSAQKSAVAVHRTDMPKCLRVKLRTVMFVEPIGRSIHDKNYAIFTVKQSNAAQCVGLTYQIVSSEIEGVPTSRIQWGRLLKDGELDELAERSSISRKPLKGRVDIAIEFLHSQLRKGPVAYAQILSAAELEGISKASLMRAKASLQVTSRKQSGAGQYSGFIWSMPDTSRETEVDPSNSSEASERQNEG